MSTINRDALLKLASLVRPALSSQNFIPAYQHIKFEQKMATAYNDITAIIVKAPFDLQGCLPGELLIKAVSSFNAESVVIQEGQIAGTLLLTSGRSKLKLPTLPVADFPFTLPRAKDAPVVELNDDIIRGIRRCLFSVGSDPTNPAQMGVTLESEDGIAVLYSTDNSTISRYQTKTKIKLPADAPLILPTFFCDQLLTLAKAFPEDDIDLEIHAGALLVTFGKNAKLLTKTVVDMQPIDFHRIIKTYLLVDEVKKQLQPIPDGFDAAWERALLVLSAELDKATLVDPAGTAIGLHSKSAMGEASDQLMCADLGTKIKEFHVNPSMVLRAAKCTEAFALYPRTMVMGDKDGAFIHLISHCVA